MVNLKDSEIINVNGKSEKETLFLYFSLTFAFCEIFGSFTSLKQKKSVLKAETENVEMLPTHKNVKRDERASARYCKVPQAKKVRATCLTCNNALYLINLYYVCVKS